MNNPNTGPTESAFDDFARRVGMFGGKAEAEIKRVITYLNDEVVPGVRKQSFTALRRAGETLTRLADEFENRPKG